MDLKKYISGLPSEARLDFARRCNTSLRHIQNIAYGYKVAGESLCINIERESNGKVVCESLRSDVDWQYLRSTQKLAAA